MTRLAVVRGAGDLATAVGRRLHLCGFAVVHLEVARPTVIRRAVAFASAVFEGRIVVEDAEARLASGPEEALRFVETGNVAVLVDPEMASLSVLKPSLFVDATMLKGKVRPAVPTSLGLAPCVIGLGPGFTAGEDVHAVVETQRGHDLGRVIWKGQAAPYSGIPGEVGGAGAERVLRAPCAGSFQGLAAIGDLMRAGDPVARVGNQDVNASIAGVVRGLLHDGLEAREGQKVGDVDPRGDRRLCFTISDKANAVAGGVLEATFAHVEPWLTTEHTEPTEKDKDGEKNLEG